MNTNQFWNAETIKAIGGLWPLALFVFLTVFIVVVVIFFLPQSRRLLENVHHFHFKRGQTEISVNQPPVPEQKPSDEAESQGRGTASKQKPDEKPSTSEAPTEQELDLEPSVRLVYHLRDGELDKAEKVFQELQVKETDNKKRIHREAMYWQIRFEKGDADAESKLRQLEISSKEVPSTLGIVKRSRAACYLFARDFRRALDLYRDSADHCVSEKGKAQSISGAAESLYENGEKAEALKLLKDTLCKTIEGEAKILLYRALARFYTREDDKFNRAVSLQRALSYRANSKELIFDTAYACANAGLTELAAFHYERLIDIDERHPSAKNNLGVAFEELKVPTLAVNYYRQAFACGETLGAANFAQILIDAGALDEAEKVLKDARAQKQVHENVSHAFVKLSNIRSKDVQKREKIIEFARCQNQYLKDYTDALLATGISPKPWEGIWLSVLGKPIETKCDEETNTIDLTWSEEEPNPYGGNEVHTFRLSGPSIGLTIRGEIASLNKRVWTSEEDAFESWGKGFATISVNLDTLTIFMQKAETHESKITKFVKAKAA